MSLVLDTTSDKNTAILWIEAIFPLIFLLLGAAGCCGWPCIRDALEQEITNERRRALERGDTYQYDQGLAASRSVRWIFHGGFWLFLAGFLLSVPAIHLLRLDGYDYVGPMRVKSAYVKSDTVTPGAPGGPLEKTVARAMVVLEWGYDWACPGELNVGHPVVCQKAVELPELSEKACKGRCKYEREFDLARAAVEFRLDAMGLKDLSNYTAYNSSAPPELDQDWPSIKAYGKCSPCSVSVTPEWVERVHLAGLFFLWVAVGIVCQVICSQAFCSQQVPPQREEPGGQGGPRRTEQSSGATMLEVGSGDLATTTESCSVGGNNGTP